RSSNGDYPNDLAELAPHQAAAASLRNWAGDLISEFACPLCLHPAGGVTNQLRPALQIKFLLQMGPVGIHSLDAQVKLPGNGVTVLALADQLENLEFTVSQAGNRR